jgi:hypothetical protein
MARFNSLFAIATSLLLVTATACSKDPAAENPAANVPKAADPPKTAVDKASSAATGAADKAKGVLDAAKGVAGSLTQIKDMKDVVSRTTAAVGKGDFATAQTEFAKLEGHWSKVENIVKGKSGDSYKKIEAEVTAVQNSLKSEDKTKSITALQSLGKTIASVATQMTAK